MFCATSTFIVCLVIAAATLAVNAEETSISEKSFGCIRDSAVKVEGTFIRHADPARLKEAVQIFEGDVADKEYPVGTTIQLIPGEAMVKESKKGVPQYQWMGILRPHRLSERHQDRQSGRLRVEYHGLLSRLPRAGS